MIEWVFFLSAYPVDDLKELPLNVLLVNGSLDGIVDKERLEESENLMPKNSINIAIEGGNHSQFGSYGLQKNDQEAETSFEKQQEKTIELIIELIENKH